MWDYPGHDSARWRRIEKAQPAAISGISTELDWTEGLVSCPAAQQGIFYAHDDPCIKGASEGALGGAFSIIYSDDN